MRNLGGRIKFSILSKTRMNSFLASLLSLESPTMTELAMPEMPALTKRQKQSYDFIKVRIVNRGYGPTVREIGTKFGIRSPNGVMCHLNALVKKGVITREPDMSRAIQLTDQSHRRSALPLAG
jgi:hypothetical protein